MEWFIVPKDEDILHYGVKGKSGRKKKKWGNLSTETDKKLSASHKSLGSMKYTDAIKYYQSVQGMSPSILSSWLQKHNIGLNAAQYKKYVMNAVKKAKGTQDATNTKHNITNRVLGNDKRYQSQDLPKEEQKKATTVKKATVKKPTKVTKEKTKKSGHDPSEIPRTFAKEAMTLNANSTGKKVRRNRILKVIKNYTSKK